MAEMDYRPIEIETKWREKWAEENLYRSTIDTSKPKHYALTMLPYPSGNLHIGHWYAIVPSDCRARFMRMRGHNVMFPMGFDAFGLPAENAAIKHNIHPKTWTFKNIDHMRGQLKNMGTMIDWEREAISADESYYRWSQWFFLQFLKNDLAYRKQSPVDWCPSCNTTLAREQVKGEDRHCERCETPVTKKDLKQWFFKTTNYADELLGFDGIKWPERVRTLQDRWIGKSVGAEVTFKTEAGDPLTVFTTRPDTLWGATFMVLAPEHPLVDKLATDETREAIETYREQAARQTEIERKTADKEKTGVFTGGYAINPVNGEKIPIWIADYVLMGYGTGAIMAVPAHDGRDFAFARAFGLKVVPVIRDEEGNLADGETMEEASIVKGTMANSGDFDGTPGDEAIDKVIGFLEEKGLGKKSINYVLRDWLVSRQRYWGSPIPIIHCDDCGAVPVPDDQLPVTLPDDVEWMPTGESPLRLHPTWRKVDCPACGNSEAERDTDTMDTFMCSSWYHLRYLSPDYNEGPFDPKEYDYWMPVDTYTGGIEHATMHLIYTRFFHKACRDIGIQKGNEPMMQLFNQGMILGEDDQKMSKSRGNVIDPDELVSRYGADTVRTYLMFFARWEDGGPWSNSGIQGTVRWIRRVHAIFTGAPEAGEVDAKTVRNLRRKLHKTLAQVTLNLESFSFNTAVAAMMELYTEMIRAREKGAGNHEVWSEVRSIYLRMLAPFAPHLAEELWRMNHEGSIHLQSWPEVDAEAAKDDEITLVVQVNGKVRAKINVAADISKEDAEKAAMESEQVQKNIEGKTVRKVIVVPGRLVNIVAN